MCTSWQPVTPEITPILQFSSPAILPKLLQVDVQIHKNDVKVEYMLASGPGGQHVNKTQSAVRVTHLSTGIAVRVEEHREQPMNRAKAFEVLRARLYELQKYEGMFC